MQCIDSVAAVIEQDVAKDLPPVVPREPHKGMPRVDSSDFANDELLHRNEIFCGRC